jgi:RNA recognition motif-containing protein
MMSGKGWGGTLRQPAPAYTKSGFGGKAGGGKGTQRGMDPAGSGRVFVRGFDFGTTDQQLEAHMSQAGNILEMHRVGKGEVEVIYQTSAEAEAALSLDRSTIPGNSRFIDVIWKESESGVGFGKKTSDAPGSGRVLVRGFDFGTSEDQLTAHMSEAGTIIGLQWVGKGEVEVVYQSSAEASTAVAGLDKTTIPGNTRFIDVVSMVSNGSDGPKGFGGKGIDVPGKGCGGEGSDPPGSGRVFVRGFNFGTTEEQLVDHMSAVGKIIKFQFAGRGDAVIVYKTKAAAAAALGLDKSTVSGNTRFLDVIPKASE